MKLFYSQVGFGGVGVDLLPTVESFPKPDTKNRTTQLKVLFPFLFSCVLFLLIFLLLQIYNQVPYKNY
jgi:hypothetical protein